jgi:hypothetical protein
VKVGKGKKSEVGPVVVPGGQDYAAAKDAEVGKIEGERVGRIEERCA